MTEQQRALERAWARSLAVVAARNAWVNRAQPYYAQVFAGGRVQLDELPRGYLGLGLGRRLFYGRNARVKARRDRRDQAVLPGVVLAVEVEGELSP